MTQARDDSDLNQSSSGDGEKWKDYKHVLTTEPTMDNVCEI